ncbi:Fe-S-cluster formation regulator IscX/YfhJ [Pedobacter sp. UYP30]|uniref:hypothetical protein n=1 Tax=Pedobacter sp. UYP30 TaxID=1756400 RepID=UPI0033946C59
MNEQIALEILTKSLDDLIRKNNHKYGFIDPSEISGDIIVNGALAIIRKRNQRIAEKKHEDDLNGIDPRDTLMSNLHTWMRAKDSIKDDAEFVEIANSFKMASLKAVSGLSMGDANYVEEEILKLASDGNVEEVITNYYVARHGFDPFSN